MTRQKVDFNIEDAGLNPSKVLIWKGVKISGRFNASTNIFNVLGIHDDNTESTITSNYPTWKQEYLDGYVSEEDKAAQRAIDKASAKAKLIAGEALTQAEADTIVI